jgi:membrane protease YdiL (CAAX protease family)
MNQPEPESPLVSYPVTDTPILPQFAYPDVRSVCKLFFVTMGFTLVGGILAAIVLEVLKYRGLNSALVKSFVNLLAYIIGFILTIWYAVKKSKKQQASAFHIGFNKIQTWLVPVIIICSIALNIGLDRVSEMIPMPLSVQKFFDEVFTKDIFSLIAIVIAAPILEEMLCRGIILNGLLKNYSPRKAILISALFFALMHMNPWQSVPAFFGGLFLGWVYCKTRSVIPGMIIHATNNAISAVFLFLPKNKQSFLPLLGEPYYIILCVLAALIFTGGCMIIYKKALPVSVQ